MALDQGGAARGRRIRCHVPHDRPRAGLRVLAGDRRRDQRAGHPAAVELLLSPRFACALLAQPAGREMDRCLSLAAGRHGRARLRVDEHGALLAGSVIAVHKHFPIS